LTPSRQGKFRQQKARWQAGFKENSDMASVPANTKTFHPTIELPLRKARGFEEVRVTPEIAQHWLTYNTSNRSIVNARVEQFKADMERGDWSDNGETIRFAYGKLLDGQHRLTALVLAGVTLRLPVMFGLDPESQVTMDTGRGRTPRDVLSIEGLGKWEAGVFGSAVHGILSARAGMLPSSTAKHTNREVRNFFLENRSAIEASLQVLHDLPRKPTPLPFSRALTMHFLFAERSREDADNFFQRLYIGDGLKTSSPIFHLRQRLMNDLVNKTKRSAFIECTYLVKTWNAFRKGASWKSGNNIYPRDGDTMEIV
jgi:hypothetical protein